MANYKIDENSFDNEEKTTANKTVEILADLCSSIKKHLSGLSNLKTFSVSENLDVGSLNQGTHQSLDSFEEYSNVVRKFISLTNKINPFKNLGKQNNVLARTAGLVSKISSTLEDTSKTIGKSLSINKAIEKIKQSELFVDMKKKAIHLEDKIINMKNMAINLKNKAINLKNKAINFKNKVISKIQAKWLKIQNGWNKMILALKTKKLAIAKKLLIGFAKILVPILAIVAAVKIIKRLARFLGRLFGRGGSAEEYEPAAYVPSGATHSSYSSMNAGQMPRPTTAISSGPKRITMDYSKVALDYNKLKTDYDRLETIVQEGSYQGMIRALNEVEGLINPNVVVNIDGDDVRSRIESRLRNVGANAIRGLRLNGKL